MTTFGEEYISLNESLRYLKKIALQILLCAWSIQLGRALETLPGWKIPLILQDLRRNLARTSCKSLQESSKTSYKTSCQDVFQDLTRLTNYFVPGCHISVTRKRLLTLHGHYRIREDTWLETSVEACRSETLVNQGFGWLLTSIKIFPLCIFYTKCLLPVNDRYFLDFWKALPVKLCWGNFASVQMKVSVVAGEQGADVCALIAPHACFLQHCETRKKQIYICFYK